MQGKVNIDRFYNLLPFVNRLPRNKMYADLSSQLAGHCLDGYARTSAGNEAPAVFGAE